MNEWEQEGLAALEIMRENVIHRPLFGKPFEFETRIMAGIYNLDENYDLAKSKTHKVVSDEIFLFRDAASKQFAEEVNLFWNSGDKFKKMGFLHKRGLLIVGPPGSGKSSLLKQEMKKLVEQGQVVFMSKSPWRLQSALASFRKKEPTRPLTVVIEDIDEVCSSYGEYQFLELLDGSESVNNVLFVATTNNMERLSEKLKRPGRFDRKIEIPNPDANLRRAYMEKKFGNKMNKQQIDNVVSLSEGLSFGHLREIVVSHCGYGANLNETIARLKGDMLNESGRSSHSADICESKY